MAQSKQVAEELFECYVKTATNIVLYCQSEKNMLDDLKCVVGKNCESDAKLSTIQEIKEHILSQYNNSQITEKRIQKVMKDYTEAVRDINVNISENERFLEFDRQLNALLRDANRIQASIDDNEDEEMQLSDSVNVIDPISKTRIKDPIRNTVCGHTYDRESIMSLLKINKKTRCPMIGCKSTGYIEVANLQTDVVMKVYLQNNPT